MTDVRSLLRNERVSRRINHPQATYSTTGTLVCLVCHIQLKSDSQWNKHLRSDQHAMRLQRIRDGTLGRPPGAPKPPDDESNGTGPPVESSNGSKKRKADDEDEEKDLRKRSKADDKVPKGFFDEGSILDDRAKPVTADEEPRITEASATTDEEAPSLESRQPTNTIPPKFFDEPTNSKPQPPPPTLAVNEDEWAAFEREVVTSPPETSILTASATISAAPLTAAEIAAQSREQASMQAKEKREAEVEGEKEDAARQMEEEFDEMAELEERVRRLREKREELRVMKMEGIEVDGEGEEGTTGMGGGDGDDEKESEDDEDDDSDGWDAWAK